MAAFRRRPRLVRCARRVHARRLAAARLGDHHRRRLALGLPAGLRQALILMAASSPIISNIAIALFVGLDAPLAAVVVVFSTALVPFTLPPAGARAARPRACDQPADVHGASRCAGGRRIPHRLAGAAGGAAERRSTAWREPIDGLAVVNLFVFALAIMDGVAAFSLERPSYALLAVALAFAFNLLLQAAGWLAFRRHGAVTALTVALMSGNCNMGLVLVALAGHVDIEITAFFALAQVPMYMLPVLLEPLYRRARARVRDARSREATRPR